ncbi:MAG: hypothetical protein HC938_17590 [Nitrospira sp.]|nr:hypothetical protein [Nitrospira sp.]
MKRRWLPALALLAPLFIAPSSAVAFTLEANPATSTVTVTGGTANASIALVGVTHDLQFSRGASWNIQCR